MKLTAALALAAAPLFAALSPRERPPFGVLLLGHGGATQWNKTVEQIRDSLQSKFPVEVAFGMADPREIQAAIDRLAAARVRKIVAVPLFVSSHSEVIDEIQFVLGLREFPSKELLEAPHAHMNTEDVRRAATDIPLAMTTALDDHPLVAEILSDRAKKMSRNPSQEYVILVGHGPNKDADNELWLRGLRSLAEQVRERVGFAGVYGATLRDDAPAEVREKADEMLRRQVRELSTRGAVIVVPHLIAQGGIERHVIKSLEGTFYKWTGETLLPDPRVARWVELKAREGAGLADMRRFKNPAASVPGPERKHPVYAQPAMSP